MGRSPTDNAPPFGFRKYCLLCRRRAYASIGSFSFTVAVCSMAHFIAFCHCYLLTSAWCVPALTLTCWLFVRCTGPSLPQMDTPGSDECLALLPCHLPLERQVGDIQQRKCIKHKKNRRLTNKKESSVIQIKA